jgi:hypothetical protein
MIQFSGWVVDYQRAGILSERIPQTIKPVATAMLGETKVTVTKSA